MKRAKRKKLKRAVVGIDPGKLGAIALISGKMGKTCIALCPGGGSPKEMYNLVASWAKEFDIALCMIEDNPAMPGNASQSYLTTGRNLGYWEAVVAILDIPVLWVRPTKWQPNLLASRQAKNKGRDTKELSCEAAAILCPHINFYGPRGGKLDGLADAFHIARWGYKYMKGEL